jgi:hypothetical protein
LVRFKKREGLEWKYFFHWLKSFGFDCSNEKNVKKVVNETVRKFEACGKFNTAKEKCQMYIIFCAIPFTLNTQPNVHVNPAPLMLNEAPVVESPQTSTRGHEGG